MVNTPPSVLKTGLTDRCRRNFSVNRSICWYTPLSWRRVKAYNVTLFNFEAKRQINSDITNTMVVFPHIGRTGAGFIMNPRYNKP